MTTAVLPLPASVTPPTEGADRLKRAGLLDDVLQRKPVAGRLPLAEGDAFRGTQVVSPGAKQGLGSATAGVGAKYAPWPALRNPPPT